MRELSFTVKDDERGKKLIRKTTTIENNQARGTIQIRWLMKNKMGGKV